MTTEIDYNRFWSPAFDDFIDKSMTPFAVGDLNGNLTYVNSACLKLWGYSSVKEVLGKPLIEFWKDKEKIVEIMDAFKDKKCWTGELTAEKKNGTTFDCRIVTNVIINSSNMPICLVASFTDVTEHNRLTNAIRESEEKYKTLVECSQEGIGVVDPDENFTFLNQAFAGMLGYKVEELVGKNLKKLTSAEEFKKYREETIKRKKGTRSRYETILYHKDGSPRLLSVSAAPLVDHNGNFSGTIGVVTDITGRKKMEEELARQSELLNIVFKTLTHPFYIIDAKNYSIIKANSAAGFADRLSKEMTCYALTHKRDKPCTGDHLCPLEEVKRTKKPVTVEHVHYDKSGGSHFVEVHGYPVFDDAGNVVQMIEYAFDVTLRKRTEEENKRLASFPQLNPMPIVEIDEKGELGFVNSSALQLFPDIKKKKAQHPFLSGIMSYFGKWEGDTHVSREVEADGRSYFQTISLVGPSLIRIYSFDITERKRAEEALQGSEARYKALFTSAAEGIIIADLKTRRFRYVNPAICRMFGYTEKEFVMLGVADIHPKESLEHVMSEFKAQAGGKKILASGLPCIRKDGTLFYADVCAALIVLDGHECNVGFFTDVTELKRAQNEVVAAKDYTDNIIKSMIDALIVVDPDAKIKTLNQAALEMLGYKEEELIGKPVGMIIEEEEEEEEEASPFKGTRFKKLLKRGFVADHKMIWKSKSGKGIPVSFSGSAMRDRDGKLVGIVTIAHDITGRKRAEEEIKNSRKQYVDLVESLTDWVWETDIKGRYTYASPRVKGILGYEPKKILGKTRFDLMPAREARRVAKIFDLLAEEQKPIVALVNIARHKDGHQVFLETSGHPFYDNKGNFKGYRGNDHDITESKRSVKLLEFYKEYAENIVGNLPLSLIVVNRDLCINFANHHFLSKMRMTKENVTEKELAKVLGKPVVEGSALDEKIIQVVKGEEARIEGRFVIKAKTFDYMIVPIKEQTGRRMNALLIMEDVTKNVMMEEQLIHSEKLSAVGTFTASVAHEINNPLSIVTGNIQYILSNLRHMDMTRKEEIEELKETLETANAEAHRCAGIVTNLLHFSHKGRSEKTKISVNSVVTATMRLLAHQLELSKVKTHIKLADDLPLVMGTADHLQQVFVNLILNAQQVMKEGGKLHVKTSLADNYVTISFRDTGPGIPKKYIRKIFEPFYSTREAGKGTGLGLFIIHSIMEEHGGKIEVQSKRGQGATFILRLPVAEKKGWFGG